MTGPSLKKDTIAVASVGIGWLILALFFGGCGGISQRNSIIDLYVDAVMLNDLNEPNQAIAKLNQAIEQNENFSLAYSLRGDIYQKLGEYEKSAASYEKATELNAWSFHDFFNLGKVYEIMKRFAQAVRAYVRACELKPDHLQAHISTARCYKQIEQYDEALIYGQRAEQINPNVLELQEILGDIYEAKQDYEQAIRSYKRALELDSDNPRLMVSLAVAYLKTEQVVPAKELLESAVEITPQNSRACRYLGYCYLRLYEKKAQAYRDAIEAQNADRNYLDSLRQSGYELVDSAIDYYTKAIEIEPNDWDSHRGLGVAYIIKGKNEDGSVDQNLKSKAIEHWRASLQINPDQPRADRLRQLIAKYRTN